MANSGQTSVPPPQYIINNNSLLSIEERYSVSTFLKFRAVPLKQTNNGVYSFIKDIDENTLNEVYICLKTRLG